MAKYHPSFSLPRRWRRSQRCWEYPSKHRRDRCERRALLDYFKRRCFHHHVGQPDTPSGVFGFVLVLYLMFFQQTAGIHIQVFGEPVHRHIRLNRLGQLGGTAFPFTVLGRIRSLPRLPVPGLEAVSKAHSPHGQAPKLGSLGLCSDITADPAGLCLPPPG